MKQHMYHIWITPCKKQALLSRFQNHYTQEIIHPVVIVEPKQSLESAGTPRDASYLLSLVSYALNVSSEGPLTIVSR